MARRKAAEDATPRAKKRRATNPARILETEFTKRLLVELGRSIPGLRVWRQSVIRTAVRMGARRYFLDSGTPIGAADISGILVGIGTRVECELKMPGGKRTPDQEQWAAFCARAGAVYALYTWDDALDLPGNLDAAVRVVRAAIDERRGRAPCP